ncbi:hypothetical protein AVEN_66372-1 [Araneus ventricosus]|uniref:Uncharacterized protein n=1 Tax=Araneus ventricosus TaxID=182803 RepID=A0A4Y2IVF0_ARAVE|nr:hypothetical protein AVEN_191899-1 [Araneus ventricosus]GBM81680.1 hypothetical protein AVEN_258001-1 [Araneus ventricosus]GBM81868.1 hypothetical protein AVEN_207746-1 [Araneus ventricosus]GBM81888.1 hypothetical protein AVEN_220757-1 [Araneus ventricosus]GBM82968.1 hypothetical protein AVEN_122299-1 [Araneus ventricosus]
MLSDKQPFFPPLNRICSKGEGCRKQESPLHPLSIVLLQCLMSFSVNEMLLRGERKLQESPLPSRLHAKVVPVKLTGMSQFSNYLASLNLIRVKIPCLGSLPLFVEFDTRRCDSGEAQLSHVLSL